MQNNMNDLISLISEIASKAAAEAVAAALAHQAQTAPQQQRPNDAQHPRIHPDNAKRAQQQQQRTGQLHLAQGTPFYLPSGWRERVRRTERRYIEAEMFEVLNTHLDPNRFKVVDKPTTAFHIQDWNVSKEHPHIGAIQLGRALWLYDSGMWEAAKNDNGRFLRHKVTGFVYEVAWEPRSQGGVEAIVFNRFPDGSKRVHEMSEWLNVVNQNNRGEWKTSLSKFHILYWLLMQPGLVPELVRKDHKPQSVFNVWLGYVSEKWLDAGYHAKDRPRLSREMLRPDAQARFVFDVLGWEAPKIERPAPKPATEKREYTPRPRREIVKIPHYNEEGEQCGFWIDANGTWRYAMIIGAKQPAILIPPSDDPQPKPVPQIVDREEPPVEEEDWMPEDESETAPIEDRATGFNWTVIDGVGRKAHALLNQEGVTPELLGAWEEEQLRGFCIAAGAEHLLPVIKKAREAIVNDGLVIPAL